MRRLKVWDAADGNRRVWSAHEPDVFDRCRWFGTLPIVSFVCVVLTRFGDGCRLRVVYPNGVVHADEFVSEAETDWPADGLPWDSLTRYDCVGKPFADYYCED